MNFGLFKFNLFLKVKIKAGPQDLFSYSHEPLIHFFIDCFIFTENIADRLPTVFLRAKIQCRVNKDSPESPIHHHILTRNIENLIHFLLKGLRTPYHF